MIVCFTNLKYLKLQSYLLPFATDIYYLKLFTASFGINSQSFQKRQLFQHQLYYYIHTHTMHNHTPSGNQQPANDFAKFNSQPSLKDFDLNIPTNDSKHTASNPNILLSSNSSKTNLNNFVNSYPYNSPHPLHNNADFKKPMNNKTQTYEVINRANKPPRQSDMSKSLFVEDKERGEFPNGTGTKPNPYNNQPPRAYRISQSTEDLPKDFYPLQRADYNHPHSGKEIKDKDEYKLFQKEKELKINLSFIPRQRQMQKSMFIHPTFKNHKKITLNDLVKLKQLGCGKYGRVFLVKDKVSNFICALKVMEKKLLHEQEITSQFIRQVKIQMFLNHPNIIKMYGCFDDATNIYILLEVGTGGQLYHYLQKTQPLPEPTIAFIMRQVCDAVNQIHSHSIIHRDIKPENIVLHDNIVKLCDFGWSVRQDNNLRTTFCGTPLYVCPEILKGEQYNEKIDIWSIGIMMYEMAVGENPFKITKEQELIKIVKEQIQIPSYVMLSAELHSFIERCLQKNPTNRASIKQLITHGFFRKHQDKGKDCKITNL